MGRGGNAVVPASVGLARWWRDPDVAGAAIGHSLGALGEALRPHRSGHHPTFVAPTAGAPRHVRADRHVPPAGRDPAGRPERGAGITEALYAFSP